MRLSTLFVSIAFVLADMSAALPIVRENMLVARFGDSNFLEAREYGQGPKLYGRGNSSSQFKRKKDKESTNSQTASSEGDTPVIHITHSLVRASSPATSSMIANPSSSGSTTDHSRASVGININPSAESIRSNQSGDTGSLIVHPPDSRNRSPERAPIALQHPNLHNQSPSTNRKLRVSTAETGQYDNLRTTALHPSQERTQPPHSHNEVPATIAHSPSRGDRTGSIAGSDWSGTTAAVSVSSGNTRVSSPHRRSLYVAF